jgi:glycosyltransferase involved in cell wall biosynthesis
VVGDPAVTVIVATYNSSKTLRFALASLLNQGFRDFEAWVVGDCCTDDSQHVVRGFGDARLNWINLDRNHGSQAFPNNEGLRRAKGGFIAYLGHDDLWFPHHLETLVNRIRATNAAFAHSLCPVFEPTGVCGRVGPPRENLGYEWHFVPPSCWLHKRAVVDEIGFWGNPDKLAWAVDLDFMRRAALRNLPISCAPRLTMLKFPSALFRIYSLQGEPPQAHYWQAIQNDPVRVELEILSQLVSRREPSVLQQFTRAIRLALRSLKHMLASHEPFHTLERIRFQRGRRMLRVKRGLEGPAPRLALPSEK